MDKGSMQWLEDLLPRKTIYWRGGAPVSNVEKRHIKLDIGSRWYIVGSIEQCNDLGQIKSPVPISDFSLLIEMLRIGELFSDFNLFVTNEENYIASHGEQINAIICFVEKYGFPNAAEELTKMPLFEIERKQTMLSQSKQLWLNATDLWQPRDGCSLIETIAAASSLFKIWSIWVQIQEKAAQDPSRNMLIETLNQQLSLAGWTVQIAETPLFYKPQLTHIIRYNPGTKKYNDYYESSNLFCILFDQLYSFIADYYEGAYPKAKECPQCGKGFFPKRNQKYCVDCRDLVASRKAVERNRRWREKHPEADKRNQEQYIENRRKRNNKK